MSSRFVPGIFAAFYTSAAFFYTEGAYLLGTTKKADITIAKKYTYVKNGSTNYMLVDDKGRHFNVDNCFFYWNWNTIEDWAESKPLDKRRIYYYSYRVPFLGMYPTIVEFSNESNKQCDNESTNKLLKSADNIKHIVKAL
jgi:hypothetical protein